MQKSKISASPAGDKMLDHLVQRITPKVAL